MVKCIAKNCDSSYRRKTQGLSFHRFPKDGTLRQLWLLNMRLETFKPKPNSMLCSKHFERQYLDTTNRLCTKLQPGAVPTLLGQVSKTAPSHAAAQPTPAIDYGDGRVSPATDPEEQEIKYEPEESQLTIDEMEIKNEPEEAQVKIEDSDRSNLIMIQDPLAQTTWQGMYKELTQSSGAALENQPSTSTLQVPNSLITGPLVVCTDTDYKTMFFKLQEEVEMLKTQNQSLLLENQSLTRQLVELRQNVEMAADVKSLQDDIIRELAEKNQKLNEQILEYTEKMRTITERYQGLSFGASQPPGQIEMSDVNTGNLQSALNDPKCCTVPEHKNLMEKVHTLSMELNQMMAENEVLKRNFNMQRRRCERLKTLSSVKSENIKKLKLSYIKLKSFYVKLKMLKSLQ